MSLFQARMATTPLALPTPTLKQVYRKKVAALLR